MNMSLPKQQGFTLIELVMVIVILGILASFAVPRFAEITVDARASTVNGLAGSLRSAAALAHATSLARAASGAQSVNMDGVSIAMINFYPTASGIRDALQDITGFSFSTSATVATFERAGATTAASCRATYTQAATGAAPTISTVTSDC